jgi:NAD(P)H-hydrate epimerase
MTAVTVAEMRSLEEAALRDGWSEEQLLETAGENLAHAIARFFPTPGTIVGYLGKGHNAGDALVALRFLRDRYHWQVALRGAFPEEKWSPLTRVKFYELGSAEILKTLPAWQSSPRSLVLLDGLLGIGAKGALREPLLALSREMAWLRENAGAKVAAIDLPSGVDPDRGEIFAGAVTADVTFMIAAAKRGLLFEHAADATGALAVVPVDSLKPTGGGGDFNLISPYTLDIGKAPRPFSFHKGQAGRVGILAGSAAFSGAAVLAATGALRGGAGLVTIHTPADAVATVAAKCPPEIIVRSCADPREILDLRYDSLVIGCGLHVEDETFRANILKLIAATELPAVIDAEALNLLSSSSDLSILKSNHLLTPHPGEFQRLAPDLKDQPREVAARTFADRTAATLLLKGSRTLVTRSGGPSRINSTGNPGMATGGQGDLLSGVIGALLAIGHPPVDAASLGAWLCGRSAERALLDPDLSPETLRATDVLDHLGGAFRDWKEQGR